MVTQIQVIIGGVVVNVILILLYFFLHREIEKFEAVKEKIIMSVKRARRSYFLSYFFAIALIVPFYFVEGIYRWALVFLFLAILIILEIIHDSKRLVLTENQVIFVQGFISYKASLAEYKDIILVEVKDDILGRIFGYGDININVYGAKEFHFKKIPNFLKVKNIIEERKIKTG